MFIVFRKATLIALFALAVLGCAPETALDRNWGRSFEAAKYSQVLNPEAGRNLAPVRGLVGPAGEISMDWYLKGFVDPNAPQKAKSTISAVTIHP